MTESWSIPWNHEPAGAAPGTPDERRGHVYLADDELRFAVQAAIVVSRPLLMRGPPGSGKSSLAPFVARNLGWRYYEKTVTGRTEANHLLWAYDALARLRASQIQDPCAADARNFVTPGVMWWAINREHVHATLPGAGEPFAKINQDRSSTHAVVLVDEIDKAEPDVPNDLLDVIGRYQFDVDDLPGTVVAPPSGGDSGAAPAAAGARWNRYGKTLVILTTNGERDLPAAFLRRCVCYELTEPKDRDAQIDKLTLIAGLHAIGQQHGTARAVAAKVVDMRAAAQAAQRREPSTAEFIDAVRACDELALTPESGAWQQISRSLLLKDLASG